jgi:hypothetical protein
MLDIPVILLVFWLAFRSNKRIADSFGPLYAEWYHKQLNNLLIYHSIFSFLFPLLPGDAIGYWNYGFQQLIVHSDNMSDYFGIGTVFLLWLDFIPAKIMGLSFTTANLLYGLVGFLGLRYLFLLYVGSLKSNIKVMGVWAVPWLFYLPNMNFWTSGVGKDTLCFFGIAWFLYSLVHFRRMFIQLILAIAMVYFIRPHMALMLGLGTGIAMIFSRDMKWGYKILFIGLAVMAFLAVYQKVAVYLMIEDLSTKSLTKLAKNKASVLGGNVVGSSVDISQYSVPMRIFTYLYRPLFFDIHNFITLLSCLENLIYLFLTYVGIRAFSLKQMRVLPLWLKAGFLSFFIATIVFANSLGNLGIIMREKNMTMIYLPMVCIWFLSSNAWIKSQATSPVLINSAR